MQNKLICGNNLRVLKEIDSGVIDLIYIDPPFGSNRDYGEGKLTFTDRFDGVERYLEWMRPRVEELYRILKETGSFYYHCDWHAGHYVKVMLDQIFGYRHFQNEIIWHYSVGGKSSRRFARKHDTLFFYTKSAKWTFNGKAVSTPRKTGTASFGGRLGIDEDGRPYQDKIAKSGKIYRYYLDEGKIPEDVWEIQTIQSQDGERFGYPTQKPEALLERIVLASSNPGDLVLDAFCGSGTTLAVAQEHGRRWIGIDVSPEAIRLAERRLRGNPKADFEVSIKGSG